MIKRIPARPLFTFIVVMGLILLSSACGQSPEAPPPAPENAQSPQSPPVAASATPSEASLPSDQAAASGTLEVSIFDDEPTVDGAPQQPSFTVFTPDLTYLQGGLISFRMAEAVIYGDEGEEPFRLRAAEGQLDQTQKRATMSGGVILESSTLSVELQDIEWINEDKSAKSANPVTIRQGETQLQAASFVFRPQGQILELTNVTGMVTPPVAAPDETPEAAPTKKGAAPEGGISGGFSAMRIDQAPSVRMARMRVESISGGVKMTLTPSDPQAKPMDIAAEELTFAYGEGATFAPSVINATGGVSISGDMGAIKAKEAAIDLASKQFRFTGDVEGASPQIERFAGDELVYGANGVILKGNVRVKAPDGEVSAREARIDQKTKRMKFSGGVRMSAPEGDIQAAEVDIDDAAKMAVFSGGVSGDMQDIKGFNASRIVYNLKTKDVDLTDLQVRDMPFGDGAPKEGADARMSFNGMAIEKAPKVRLKSGKLESVTGGIVFRLKGAGAKPEDLRVSAATAGFEYSAADAKMPDSVKLGGGVKVDGALGRISSKDASMNTKTKALAFSGGVEGSTPEIPNFKAETLNYEGETVILVGGVHVEHPQGTIEADRAEAREGGAIMDFTGNVVANTEQIHGLTADRIVYNKADGSLVQYGAKISSLQPKEQGAPEAQRITSADIKDWPRLLATLKEQAASTTPSPGQRVTSLIPERLRTALANLTIQGETPDEVKTRIVKELNRLLMLPGLHDAAAWKDASLSEETRALLKGDPAALPKEQLAAVNLELLRTGFPGCW